MRFSGCRMLACSCDSVKHQLVSTPRTTPHTNKHTNKSNPLPKMKTAICSLLVLFAAGASAFAGTATYSSKSTKNVTSTAPALGCDCFAPGAALGIYGAY